TASGTCRSARVAASPAPGATVVGQDPDRDTVAARGADQR
ncbi:4-(cytidine 5'-diphospho)-2-C-methyl-D-erythritol kinase, partial [Streptomyces sp. SID8014]|nr:4-(cytidine 5'-diphospho)-2-C-methyl-D-erythritol kinase [Streptomyces sp. SID8014]NEE57696.1 4-(cytidine 5'-diphospho)-2-C-methyl-D-erythritol kinase [Streptomyces sp. SID8455]